MRIGNEAVVQLLNNISNSRLNYKQIDNNIFEEGLEFDETLPTMTSVLYTLMGEWDLIANLQPLLLDSTLIQADISWIKSHQDHKTPYNLLELPVQLNCDADELAMKAHDQPPRHDYNEVPLAPKTPVHIDIDGKTLTSKYQQNIRRN